MLEELATNQFFVPNPVATIQLTLSIGCVLFLDDLLKFMVLGSATINKFLDNYEAIFNYEEE
jgi:hypothetical protein